MASSGAFTVTGKIGPGNTLTAVVYSSIASFAIDIVNQLLVLTGADGIIKTISIAAATTITVTLSAAAGNYTITIA